MTRWVTVGEAAKSSGMSVSRIRRLCNLGCLKSKRHAANGWRYVSPEDIAKYLDSLKSEYGIDHERIRERMKQRCKKLQQGKEVRS